MAATVISTEANGFIVRVAERFPHLPFARLRHILAHGRIRLRLHSGQQFKHLYIGVTSRLQSRIADHKDGRFPDSFTGRYNIKHLVYFERWASMHTAIAREKQLKRWSRVKKIALIVKENPTWRDLSEDWCQPIEPYAGPM